MDSTENQPNAECGLGNLAMPDRGRSTRSLPMGGLPIAKCRGCARLPSIVEHGGPSVDADSRNLPAQGLGRSEQCSLMFACVRVRSLNWRKIVEGAACTLGNAKCTKC